MNEADNRLPEHNHAPEDRRPPARRRWPADNRWAMIVVAGLILLALPTAIRLVRERGSAAPPISAPAGYTPPAVETPALAVTPIPTATPRRSDEAGEAGAPGALAAPQLPRPSVVVDLAHYSLIERARFQPLAAALAQAGVDLRFWLPTVDTRSLEQLTDFPDLSAELEKQLAGAGALVVVSPFFLYTPAEISVVERFVADGGRLLLISDPDVESDSASDTNQLASAFNVIFNQDYLYDTAANDENFTYFFQGEFAGDAADLAGSRIAFYGGRSISGAVVPLVRSAGTTLSSLRSGLTSFNTVVLGGSTANGSQGRVLALSDFDVLTDPYVARHDNRRMLQFVSDFLGGAARDNGLPDFPNFLGKEVALAIDNTQPAGALALGKAAELQRALEANGRVLTLAPAGALTSTLTGTLTSTLPGPDLIYVAGYRALLGQEDLLADLDLRLVEEVVTPTVDAPAVTPASAPVGTPGAATVPTDGAQPGQKGTPLAPVAPPEVPPLGTPTPFAPEATPGTPLGTPVGTPTALPPATPTGSTDGWGAPPAQIGTPAATEGATAAATIAATVAATATAAGTAAPTDAAAPVEPILESTLEPTGESAGEATGQATDETTAEPTPTATPTPTPTPQIRLLLERTDGLRLLADETLLYVRRPRPGGSQLLAVLGSGEQALSAALTRLINRDFGGCLVQSDLILCPYSSGTSGGTSSGSAPGGSSGSAAGGAAPGAGTAGPSVTPSTPGPPTPTPQATGAPDAPGAPQAAHSILIVDDNGGAAASEPSEAAIYLTALTTAGYTPDLWVVSEQGPPAGSDLTPYAWVIWSDAGYDDSAIDTGNLAIIGEYINGGGRLTISSRMPFFGVGAKTPSVIKDIQVAGEVPDLVVGLPSGPIALVADSPVLSPLEENPDPGAGARTALARGPASADAGAPVLILMTDAGFEDPKGARLLLFGISMGWLPPAVSDQLIRNMADVMLAE